MSTSSVLIAPSDNRFSSGPRYSLLLTTDPDDIRAVQRLRYDVFSTESGFGLRNDDHVDADRFDEHCDHLIVREDGSGDIVGCYRMLPPPSSTSAHWTHCGPHWSRWAGRWCAATTATVPWC
jgi:putative hemolysin